MGFSLNSTMNKALKIGIEYTMLQLADQTINAQSSVPPLVKTLVGFGTDFAGYEIIDKALDMLPPNMRGIGKTLNKAQASIFAIQQLPNLIAAIQGASTGNFLGTGQ